MKKLFALMIIAFVFVGIAVAPVLAQTFPQGSKTFGAVVPMVGGTEPVQVQQTGIMGRVLDYDGNPIPGSSISVSLVKRDGQTQQDFVDRSTTKVFDPCTGGLTTNCVQKDGSYTINTAVLPQSQNQWWEGDSWTLDVRAKAPGYVHWHSNIVRVGLDGNSLVGAPVAQMWKNSFVTSKLFGWRASEKVIGIGLWVKQDWNQEVIVDFIIDGSAKSAEMVEYGIFSDVLMIGPDYPNYNGWNQLLKGFAFPPSETANSGGTLCGVVQIRARWDAEDVKAKLGRVCVPLVAPQQEAIYRDKR